MRKFIALIIGAVIVLPVPTSANLIVNGSFEEGSGDPGSSITLTTNSTTITGWMVSYPAVDWVGSLWIASDGVRSVELNAAGQIEQAITTIAGIQYSLSFDMAGNPAQGGTKYLTVQIANQSTDFSFNTSDKTTQNMGWTRYNMIFTATDATTILLFKSKTGNIWGPAIDNVSIELVPEPATIGFLMAGMGFLFLQHKQIKNNI